MLKDKRLSGADEDAAGPDVQEEPGPSSCPQTVNIQVTLRYALSASQLVSNKAYHCC